MLCGRDLLVSPGDLRRCVGSWCVGDILCMSMMDFPKGGLTKHHGMPY